MENRAVSRVLLFVGEQIGTSLQGAPAGVERIGLAAAVPAGVQLDPTPAFVEGVAGQSHHVERVHHCRRPG